MTTADGLTRPTLGGAEGIPHPGTDAWIEQLTSEFGTEYAQVLTRAVQDSKNGDQEKYRAGLAAAIDVLVGLGGDRPACTALAVSHVGVFLTEITADGRMASHYSAMPPMPPQNDQSKETMC